MIRVAVVNIMDINKFLNFCRKISMWIMSLAANLKPQEKKAFHQSVPMKVQRQKTALINFRHFSHLGKTLSQLSTIVSD